MSAKNDDYFFVDYFFLPTNILTDIFFTKEKI